MMPTPLRRGGESVSPQKSVDEPGANRDEETGLPGLRTWRSVYVFILVSFGAWVSLLFALGLFFR
jgi:hypothetical protein